MSRTVAVYFVASPLQYLAARAIAAGFERGSRQVLVWYKRSVGALVQTQDWDIAAYMPWPRWEPLPGVWGRLRRLRANIDAVAALVGPCEHLHLHSAVYDTEAINYFLRALPPRVGAHTMRARILPDGLISTRRYPLSLLRRVLQYPRKLRRLMAPELDYWCFGGDRIGSDADFCDRIYVLSGLPHAYPAHKVQVLPGLARASAPAAAAPRRALVIGQPLSGFALMSAADVQAVTMEVHAALVAAGFEHIDYKPHPKDRLQELAHADYRQIAPVQALESHLATEAYALIVGVRSSALLLARQICPPGTRVEAFGWSRIRFKSEAERQGFEQTFCDAGVVLHP